MMATAAKCRMLRRIRNADGVAGSDSIRQYQMRTDIRTDSVKVCEDKRPTDVGMILYQDPFEAAHHNVRRL